MNLSAVTLEGPFGQAKEISADNTTAFKTYLGMTRYLANNGGGFAEAVLRTVFGYEPSWLLAAPPQPLPPLASQPRGVAGTLSCIRGPGTAPPYAFATATLGSGGNGVTWTWGDSC
jgi:hypothetical protein